MSLRLSRFFLVAVALAAVACKKEITVVQENCDPLILSRAAVTMYPGENVTITIEGKSDDLGAVTWTTSSSHTATVSNGGIQALNPGYSLITAEGMCRGEKMSDHVQVTVLAHPAVVISVSPKLDTLYPAQTITVTSSVTGGAPGTSQAVAWLSRDVAIAGVSNTGLINAVASGETYIVASSVAEPAKKDSVKIVVINVSMIFTANPTSMTLFVNEEKTGTIEVLVPVNAPATADDIEPVIASGVQRVNITVLTRSIETVGQSKKIVVNYRARGLAVGTASVIWQSKADHSQKITVPFTVNLAPPPNLRVRSITIQPNSVTLGPSEETRPTVTVDADAGLSKAYTCASNDAALVTVLMDGSQVVIKRTPAAYPALVFSVEVTCQTVAVDPVNGRLHAAMFVFKK